MAWKKWRIRMISKNTEIKKELIEQNSSEVAWQVSKPILNCIINVGKEIIKKEEIKKKGNYE